MLVYFLFYFFVKEVVYQHLRIFSHLSLDRFIIHSTISQQFNEGDELDTSACVKHEKTTLYSNCDLAIKWYKVN